MTELDEEQQIKIFDSEGFMRVRTGGRAGNITVLLEDRIKQGGVLAAKVGADWYIAKKEWYEENKGRELKGLAKLTVKYITSELEGTQEILNRGKEIKEERQSAKDKEDLSYIIPRGTIFFQDQFGEPFAFVPVGEHKEVWPVDSGHYKKIVTLWVQEAKVKLTRDNIANVVLLSEAEAYKSRLKYILYNRCGYKDEVYYLDLCNDKWEVVEIRKGEWEITNLNEPMFIRYPHMKPLVIDKKGKKEDFDKYFEINNFSDEKQKILAEVFTIISLNPEIPKPIIAVNGDHGSAKSFLTEAIKTPIDPSCIMLLSLPKDSEALVQQFQHNYMAFYDNVSFLNSETADMFCRGCTGTGFSKRQLFTDDSDILYQFKRCLGMNGISTASFAPDFLDRSIRFYLKRIEEANRKTEKEVRAMMESLAPKILNYMLNVFSNAMGRIDDVSLEMRARLPRMADFTIWGESVAEELGVGGRDNEQGFYAAYIENLNRSNYEAIEGSIVGSLILKLMEGDGTWEGSSTQLLESLQRLALDSGLDLKASGFPGNAAILGRRVAEIRVNLKEIGMNVSQKEEHLYNTYLIQKDPKYTQKVLDKAAGLRSDGTGGAIFATRAGFDRTCDSCVFIKSVTRSYISSARSANDLFITTNACGAIIAVAPQNITFYQDNIRNTKTMLETTKRMEESKPAKNPETDDYPTE